MATAQTPANQETPESLFKTNCALCHGDDGAGTELGKRFKVKDLRSKEVQDKSSADLAQIVHDGKNNMPPFGKRLDDKQIESLIGYIRHLASTSH
jgi:mono/diheme cytochrome c family protein